MQCLHHLATPLLSKISQINMFRNKSSPYQSVHHWFRWAQTMWHEGIDPGRCQSSSCELGQALQKKWYKKCFKGIVILTYSVSTLLIMTYLPLVWLAFIRILDPDLHPEEDVDKERYCYSDLVPTLLIMTFLPLSSFRILKKWWRKKRYCYSDVSSFHLTYHDFPTTCLFQNL